MQHFKRNWRPRGNIASFFPIQWVTVPVASGCIRRRDCGRRVSGHARPFKRGWRPLANSTIGCHEVLVTKKAVTDQVQRSYAEAVLREVETLTVCDSLSPG